LVAPANKVDVTARGSAEIARVSLATTNKSASPVKHESASVPDEAIVPSAAMTQPDAESVPAANVSPAASAARSLRVRGIFAYRNGDGPIADLLYRLRKFDRVFADFARRSETKTRAAPNLRQRWPGSSALIRPKSHLR
jgi:hypothetical protein